MIYCTLNRRSIKRIAICSAAAVIFATLFCLWAVSAKRSQQPDTDKTALSSTDVLAQPVNPAVVSFSDAAPVVEITPSEQIEQSAEPANATPLSFEVDQTVALPVKNAYISSAFGFREHPVNGTYSFHNGLDLAAPEGTDILAMLGGKVVTAESASDYGNYIILDHGSFQTLYAHCRALYVSIGEEVIRGQKIAEVGSTGRATGSHLHVEIRSNGKRYDPAVVLGDAYL